MFSKRRKRTDDISTVKHYSYTYISSILNFIFTKHFRYYSAWTIYIYSHLITAYAQLAAKTKFNNYSTSDYYYYIRVYLIF